MARLLTLKAAYMDTGNKIAKSEIAQIAIVPNASRAARDRPGDPEVAGQGPSDFRCYMYAMQRTLRSADGPTKCTVRRLAFEIGKYVPKEMLRSGQ